MIGVDRASGSQIAMRSRFPVLEVQVDDLERDRAAERLPVPDTGLDLDPVGLDLHAPAAAVAQLATREIAVDVIGSQRQASRKALDQGNQRRPVGLPRRSVRQGHTASLQERGARRPRPFAPK